jgi:hypothetical protein
LSFSLFFFLSQIALQNIQTTTTYLHILLYNQITF